MTNEKLLSKCYEHKSIIADESGFYVFWPSASDGAYTADNLRVIADEIDRQNAPYIKELDDYFMKELGIKNG